MSKNLRFIEKLEKNAEAYPEATALISTEAGKRMSYAELWEYSGRVYRYLKQNGVGKESTVMIAVPRGINPIITLIGVWRAGAAAVMLASDCEPERMAYIRQDAGCVMKIDAELLRQIMTCAPLDGHEETDPHDLAYLIYTSGTTGKPKGVMQEYGTLDMCVSMHYCGDRSVIDGRFALIAPLTSAAAMLIIPPLLYNLQTLAVIPMPVVRDPDGLPGIPASLTKIVVGGEPARRLFSDRVELFCGYGQSESGFNITTFLIDREYDITPVGRLGGQKAEICILDEEGKPLPRGEKGNLCYRAPYFRGYVGLPELTAAVHLNGYVRSGDIAEICPDGTIVITGRADEMIKIRGNRIEPAEVEAVLREALQVEWVGVRAILDQEHPYLCAYYEEEPKRSLEEARRFAAERLPYYMMPACFMKIDAIPRDAGGKIAKKKLPIPERKDNK